MSGISLRKPKQQRREQERPDSSAHADSPRVINPKILDIGPAKVSNVLANLSGLGLQSVHGQGVNISNPG